MNLIKQLLPVALFLTLLPIAFAEITIQLPDQLDFNLGDRIDASISIKETEEQKGFFNVHDTN